uniref:Lipoprotein n=1 Tax=Streptomyces sp. NBC_00003 TaxID=2903608 RepID=A0AAU2V9M6_9ACTN
MPLPTTGRRARTAVCAFAVLALAGCSAGEGVRDDGPAASPSGSVSASPLWPDHTAPVTPTKPGQGFHARGPVPGVTVPDGDLTRVAGVRLLAADPATDRAVQSGLKECPDGSSCRLRPPAYADLTGDGQRELVLAYDDLGRTILWVYAAVGEQAHAVLEYAGRPGTSAATLGGDLVVTEPAGGRNRESDTTLRWNGTELAPLPAASDPAKGASRSRPSEDSLIKPVDGTDAPGQG